MVKLLIVEDEPLVQIGIRSILNGSNLDIEVCGVAKDGVQALEMIDENNPKIVITDIKMHGIDGLELIRISRERFGQIPLFIIITNYDEFNYLKEAMKLQVIEYFLKSELKQDELLEAISKALYTIEEIEHKYYYTLNESNEWSLQSLHNSFFIKLLFNLFDNVEEELLNAKDIPIDINAHSNIVCYCEILEFIDDDDKKSGILYTSSLTMVQEIIKKYIKCCLYSLDTRHFVMIFGLNEEESNIYREIITEVLNRTFTIIHSYFNVTILSSIGSPCYSPLHIADSFQESRQIFSYVSKEKPILFYEVQPLDQVSQNICNMVSFRNDIKKAFEELNSDSIVTIFNLIIDVYRSHQSYYLQSMDAASNILFLAMSLLPNGDEVIATIFQDEPDGYRSLYKQTNVEQVTQWIATIRDGLCNYLNSRKNNNKNYIVTNVKKYIDMHLSEKLTLHEVSSVFGISPNYLSQLFKKYNDDGFTEYITKQKIAKAKELMRNGPLKLYEISDMLGFENSFYFSKVFKKVEGCSPREYWNHIH